MSGNVWEWTQDGYGDYPSGSVTDPIGAESFYRIVRGGHWAYDASEASVSYRGSLGESGPGSNLGFRLARTSP